MDRKPIQVVTITPKQSIGERMLAKREAAEKIYHVLRQHPTCSDKVN